MTAFLVPAVLCTVIAYGLYKRVDVYDALVCGIKTGLGVCRDIFPALLIMMTVITMLRASGAVDLLSRLAAPLVEPLGIPASCIPLALLRPFSGSGALAIGSGIMAQAGPDSLAGRIAAVMLGSSETSFYVVAMYSAFLGLKNTGYTLKAALCADLAAFLLSGIAVRLLMG